MIETDFTQPLRLDVTSRNLHIEREGITVLREYQVGNSGMTISVARRNNSTCFAGNLHYTPDYFAPTPQTIEPTTDDKVKYGSIFQAAMYALTEHYQSDNNKSADCRLPRYISMVTNRKMHQYALKTLGKKVCQTMDLGDDFSAEDFGVIIDLQAICQNPDLYDFLKKERDVVLSANYTMDWFDFSSLK